MDKGAFDDEVHAVMKSTHASLAHECCTIMEVIPVYGVGVRGSCTEVFFYVGVGSG